MDKMKNIADDTIAVDVHVRHPNRNTDKHHAAQSNSPIKSKQTIEAGNRSKNDVTKEPLNNAPAAEELPENMDKATLSELAAFTSECCISIYLPTHQSGMEINERQDAIHFKNALQKAARQLKDKGYHEDTIKQWLVPAYQFHKDDAFWTQQSKGLAIFISDNYCRYLRMQQAPLEKVYINKTFALGPLISLMIAPEYFYLLVISKHQAKLFRTDAYGMTLIDIPDMPDGIEAVKRLSELDATTFRASGAAAGGGANYHGIGGGNPDDKTNIAVYLEAVDDKLWDAVLKQENVPLVLAGVEYLLPIYRSVSDYKHISEHALTGSHEHEDISTLYPRVKALMQPYFEERQRKALELYDNRSATPLASTNPAEIIPATHYGRVSYLFVTKGEYLWGQFDEQNNKLTIQSDQDGDNEDLVDKAITNTLLTGGEVFMLDNAKMPASSAMAAIFRYEEQ